MRKSWSTVSNSPGALCRISSSVAGLIPGERTSATPRSVLQISDRHLRRYPIHNAHMQVVIWDNDLGILERMKYGVHSSTTGASALQRRQAGTAFADLLSAMEALQAFLAGKHWILTARAKLVGHSQRRHAWLLR